MRNRMHAVRWIALALAALPRIVDAAPSETVPSLAWMAGTWTGTSGGLEMEEHWTPPKGGSLLGLHRDVANGRMVSFEFFRIEESAAGTTYWASPRGAPPTPFRMVSRADRRVVFENPQHDFPTRILYWLTEDGALHAKIEGTRGGEPAAEEWTWRRAR